MKRLKCPKCKSEDVVYLKEESINLKCNSCGEIFREGETNAHKEIEKLTGRHLPTGAELAMELLKESR